MSAYATVDMCCYAFDILHAQFKGNNNIEPFDSNLSCPVFVTLYKNDELRGCIGSLRPHPIRDISYYVLSR